MSTTMYLYIELELEIVNRKQIRLVDKIRSVKICHDNLSIVAPVKNKTTQI